MDEKKWQEHQQKLAELRRRFSRLRWRVRLWWALYNVAADVLLLTLVAEHTSYPLALALVLASTIFSTMMMNNKNKKWVALQQKQELELMEKAPVGKIRLYE